MLNQWLCTVMSCAYGYAKTVEYGANVCRVYITYKERDGSAIGLSEYLHIGDCFKLLNGITCQLVFVCSNIFYSQ
jgi:hypothetical protein